MWSGFSRLWVGSSFKACKLLWLSINIAVLIVSIEKGSFNARRVAELQPHAVTVNGKWYTRRVFCVCVCVCVCVCLCVYVYVYLCALKVKI
jgi:hypothetical protein